MSWKSCGLGCLVTSVVFGCIGFGLPLDFEIAILFGWVFYLARVLPEVRVDAWGVVTAVACLVLFAGGVHLFLDWLYSQTRAETAPGRWRGRWTGSLVAAVVVLFVAGLATVGVTHQVGWLVTSRERWVESGQGFVWRVQSINNLKQIGLALHNYHDATGSLPPGGVFDRQGRPDHGWEAFLLPYMEQQAIYNEINFQVPWDDPRNAKPYRAEVNAYLNPGVRSRDNKDAAGRALTHYSGNALLLGGDTPRTLRDVTDGTGETIMAGEVPARFVAWGYPANWRDPALGINRSPDGFGGPYVYGANFLFADGSIKFLKNSIDPHVLKALGTPDGGETIRPEDY